MSAGSRRDWMDVEVKRLFSQAMQVALLFKEHAWNAFLHPETQHN